MPCNKTRVNLKNGVASYVVEKTVTLCKVDDVDMDFCHVIAGVLHAEIEPLQVTRAIGVVTHEAVKGVVASNAHLVQVGALKVSIKSHLGPSACVVEGHGLTLCVRNGLRLPGID